MKFPLILSLILLTGCVTVNDRALRDRLVGSWLNAPDDGDPAHTSIYRSDGTFTTKITEPPMVCQGTWDVLNGHFEEYAEKSKECPIGGRRTSDIILSVDDHDSFFRAEDGIVLHRERDEKIQPPQSSDTFYPKFAWPDQGQVHLRDKTIMRKGQMISDTQLRWSRNKDQWLISSDYPQIVVDGSRAVNIQAAPGKISKFRVDANGRFLDLLDWKNDPLYLVIRSTQPHPWDDSKAQAFTRDANEDNWQRVQLWSAIVIENGKAKWKADAANILPPAYNPANLKVEYKGRCSRSPQCVVLELTGKRDSTEGSNAYLDFTYNKPNCCSHVDERRYVVHIDFATLRPFKVSLYEHQLMRSKERHVDVSTEHHRFYNWNNIGGWSQ